MLCPPCTQATGAEILVIHPCAIAHTQNKTAWFGETAIQHRNREKISTAGMLAPVYRCLRLEQKMVDEELPCYSSEQEADSDEFYDSDKI